MSDRILKLNIKIKPNKNQIKLMPMKDKPITLFYSVDDFKGENNLINIIDFDKNKGKFKSIFKTLDKIRFEPSPRVIENILSMISKAPIE